METNTVNPLFAPRSEEADRSALPLRRLSARGLEIPADTTLKKEDWDMIEDDLLPFECTAILISIGGIGFIAITIHAIHGHPTLVPIGTAFLDGVGASQLLTFFLVIPCVVGVVQILLAIFFSMLAAVESWKHVSCQDVIRHHLPEKMEDVAKRLPLTCTARKAYLALMWIFLFIQIIASGIAYGLTVFIDEEANKGSDGATSGLLREVLDYSAIIFNECCAAKGWSKQGVIPPCAPGTSELNSCPVPEELVPVQHRLCACYVTAPEDAERYARYANQSNVCQVLQDGIITIAAGQRIPGTSISIRTLVPPNVPSIPIVGDMTTEYGCGTGFLRGYQWAFSEWTTNELAPYFVAMLVISGLQMFFLLAGASFVCRMKISRQPTRIGEDGNIEYGEAKPLEMPQGLRALLFKDKDSNGGVLSPKIAMPRFRSRSNSSGMKTNKTTSPTGFELSTPQPIDNSALLSSPDMMKLAAKHSSAKERKGKTQVEDIDGVI